jgi:glyoxylase-like metal-dependent hydrolase (beta-lactamase superfamily II)
MPAPPSPTLEFPFAHPPAAGEVIDIGNGIRWMRMPLPFALDHINLWLLDGADATTLVDTGYGDPPTRALWERHFATTLDRRSIDRVVVTHCHPDHVGNASWLAARFSAPVLMTHAEFMATHALAHGHSGYGPDGIIALFQRHGLAGAHLDELAARGNHYRRGVPDVPATFTRLLDGRELVAGPTRWRIIEGHGHSPEHASLYSRDLGVLISGDMLLPKISTNISVWAVEPDADPLGSFLESLSAFRSLPADTLVLPSHGMPFRGVGERIAQLVAHHAARLDELVTAARAATGPVSAADLVPVLFRRELDAQQRFFAMGEAIAHLNHLWHAGRLARSAGANGALSFAVANPPPLQRRSTPC